MFYYFCGGGVFFEKTQCKGTLTTFSMKST